MTEKTTESLPGPVRRARMVAMIEDRDFVRVADLSEAFGISEVTVRSDLDRLRDSVRRVRGGAMRRTRSAVLEPSFEEAMSAWSEAKARIGATAAARVQSGMSLILDVGSTTTAVARALAARSDLEQVTVVTNSITIALEIEPACPRFQVVVTGGTLRPRQHSLVDPLASVLLQQIHVDIAFIGCNGIDATSGLTNVNMPEAVVKRRMIDSSEQVVIVADGSKVGQVHFARVAEIDEIDMLITADADPDEVERLRGVGIEVVNADA